MHKNEETQFPSNLSQLKRAHSPFLRASYLDRGESHLGKALAKCSLYNKLPGFVVPKSDRALCVNNGNLLKAVNLFSSSSQARRSQTVFSMHLKPGKKLMQKLQSSYALLNASAPLTLCPSATPPMLAPALKVSRPHIWGRAM